MYKNLSTKTVLIAEDDLLSNENLSYMLEKIFENVISSHDGYDAYQQYLKHKPDIIFTDIEMPKVNGLDLVKKIRKIDIVTPIVIFTSFTEKHYLLMAVNLQLFSYIIKPITRSGLNNALEKLNRTFEKKESTYFFLNGELFYDFERKNLQNQDSKVPLTYQESVLLEQFIRNKNMVLNSDMLEQVLDTSQSIQANALKLAISRLRKKLPKDMIKTI